MGKFLRSLTDGSLRCKYCGDRKCLCMEDGQTELGIIAVYKDTGKATLIQFRRQTLPNGKEIPSGYKIWIPNTRIYGIDYILKMAVIDNDSVNKMVFC